MEKTSIHHKKGIYQPFLFKQPAFLKRKETKNKIKREKKHPAFSACGDLINRYAFLEDEN